MKSTTELRQLLNGMRPKTVEIINDKGVYKTKKGLFKLYKHTPADFAKGKKPEHKLEHMVKILAGKNYLIADPFEGRRRKTG